MRAAAGTRQKPTSTDTSDECLGLDEQERSERVANLAAPLRETRHRRFEARRRHARSRFPCDWAVSRAQRPGPDGSSRAERSPGCCFSPEAGTISGNAGYRSRCGCRARRAAIARRGHASGVGGTPSAPAKGIRALSVIGSTGPVVEAGGATTADCHDPRSPRLQGLWAGARVGSLSSTS